ncbi:hypothetical protein V2O64_05225 [Verrucomicrobiaceae bacterium 227]
MATLSSSTDRDLPHGASPASHTSRPTMIPGIPTIKSGIAQNLPRGTPGDLCYDTGPEPTPRKAP